MWKRNEDDYQIDIQPWGEEGKHIFSQDCECGPTLSRSDTKKLMIIHRTYDGMAGFMPVAEEMRKVA